MAENWHFAGRPPTSGSGVDRWAITARGGDDARGAEAAAARSLAGTIAETNGTPLLHQEMSTVNAPRSLARFREASRALSRRNVMASLAAGLLAAGSCAFGTDHADARRKRRQRKRKDKRKKGKGAKIRVAATCPGSGPLASGTDSGDNRIAQTFVALSSGPLVKARLAMLRVFASTGDFELRLVEVDGAGVPTDEVLATSTVASDQVPNERADIDFAFRQPFAVKAGGEYGLVLTRPGGGVFGWFGENARRCPGGPFFSPDQAEPFRPGTAPEFDHTFTVFVRS